MSIELTQDTILGGRVHLFQPKDGYRVAIDPIFLAASIPAQNGDSVLDIGTGVGAAALCLAHRVAECNIVGLELQRDMARIAQQNIDANNCRPWVEVLQGDLLQPPPRLAPSTFSHVMANPPFYDAARATPAGTDNKHVSHTLPDGMTSLKAWVNFAQLMVRPKGTVTFIYPTERLHFLLPLLTDKLGGLTIYPLWSGENKGAKRVLIRGIKSTQLPTRLERGMTLHDQAGKYTAEADAVLRSGGAIIF